MTIAPVSLIDFKWSLHDTVTWKPAWPLGSSDKSPGLSDILRHGRNLWQGQFGLTITGRPWIVWDTLTGVAFLGQPGTVRVTVTVRDTLTGVTFGWPSLDNQGWSEWQWWLGILWQGWPLADCPRTTRVTGTVEILWQGWPMGDHPGTTRDSQSYSDCQGYSDRGAMDGQSGSNCQGYSDMQRISDGTSSGHSVET